MYVHYNQCPLNAIIELLYSYNLHDTTLPPRQMLVVTRGGAVQIRDSNQASTLCQVELPPSHDLTSPWEPVIALGNQGKTLFVKGQLECYITEAECINSFSNWNINYKSVTYWYLTLWIVPQFLNLCPKMAKSIVYVITLITNRNHAFHCLN